MTETITQERIESIARQAVDFMYRQINNSKFVSPKAFIAELGKNREGADTQALEAILVDFLASVAYGEKLVIEESDPSGISEGARHD